jgi:hypothetical protein
MAERDLNADLLIARAWRDAALVTYAAAIEARDDAEAAAEAALQTAIRAVSHYASEAEAARNRARNAAEAALEAARSYNQKAKDCVPMWFDSKVAPLWSVTPADSAARAAEIAAGIEITPADLAASQPDLATYQAAYTALDEALEVVSRLGKRRNICASVNI